MNDFFDPLEHIMGVDEASEMWGLSIVLRKRPNNYAQYLKNLGNCLLDPEADAVPYENKKRASFLKRLVFMLKSAYETILFFFTGQTQRPQCYTSIRTRKISLAI